VELTDETSRAQEKHEAINVMVKYPSGGQQKTVEVSVNFNLGDFCREAQQVFGIPKNRETFLMLEKLVKF
jgi:hypothetical protein